jgi:outer membrane lipoprotein-sorting protein
MGMIGRTAVAVIGGAFVVVASCSPPPPPIDTLESVEKAIVDRFQNVRSLQCRLSTAQNQELEGVKFEGRTDGLYEYVKKGDKIFYRSEMKNKLIRKQADTEEVIETTSLMVADGEVLHVLTEGPDGKSARKTKTPPPTSIFPDRTYFDNLHATFDLKLLPDAALNGTATYAIEANAKTVKPGAVNRMTLFFDKATAMALKTVGVDESGKTVLTMRNSDIQVNAEINPDRFVFKAPEGVQVVDMTKEPEPTGSVVPSGVQPPPNP